MPDHFSQVRLKLHPHLLPFVVDYYPISKLLDSRQTSVAEEDPTNCSSPQSRF